MELTQEQIETAQEVINIERKEREEETLNEAFINRIEETLDKGDLGYTREIVLPIPSELVSTSTKVKSFLTKVGEISRDKRYGLPIKLETETVQDVALLNVVFAPDSNTNLDLIKEKL